MRAIRNKKLVFIDRRGKLRGFKKIRTETRKNRYAAGIRADFIEKLGNAFCVRVKTLPFVRAVAVFFRPFRKFVFEPDFIAVAPGIIGLGIQI